jgi:hypothetical protein
MEVRGGEVRGGSEVIRLGSPGKNQAETNFSVSDEVEEYRFARRVTIR